MISLNLIFKKIIRFFSSLKLAVVILTALAIVSAIGTIIESRYNTDTAKAWIYDSIYMWSILALLAIVLIAVMISRWPWKYRHIGFLLAHTGIITLLFGAYITSEFGIDGTIRFEIGETNRYLFLKEDEINIYKMSHEFSTRLFSHSVNFLKNEPTKLKPFNLETPIGEIKIENFLPFALEDRKWHESTHIKNGPALRFQIENKFVNMTDWIALSLDDTIAVKPMGPAQIILTKNDYQHQQGHEIVFQPVENNKIRYTLYSKDSKTPQSSEIVRAGKVIQTGWMGAVIRLLKYIPHAEQRSEFKAIERPTDSSTSAIFLQFNNQKTWVGRNSFHSFWNHGYNYVLTYGFKKIDLGFNLTLEKFDIGRYEGTRMAKSYQSLVRLENGEQHLISMNEPLKHLGFTLYQASFEENSMGEPTASILSVNKDPGREIKYLGSLLIVLGCLFMFYLKRSFFFSRNLNEELKS